jgi:hypothetical protein
VTWRTCSSRATTSSVREAVGQSITSLCSATNGLRPGHTARLDFVATGGTARRTVRLQLP